MPPMATWRHKMECVVMAAHCTATHRAMPFILAPPTTTRTNTPEPRIMDRAVATTGLDTADRLGLSLADTATATLRS